MEVLEESAKQRAILLRSLQEFEEQLAAARSAQGPPSAEAVERARVIDQSRLQVLELLQRLSGELRAADPADAVRIAAEVKNLMQVAGRLQTIRAM